MLTLKINMVKIKTITNSLMYEIKTEDVYEHFSNDKEMFDVSNYSTISKYYDDSNKLVVHKMKDETAGVVIKELVGLKEKMYSYWYTIIVTIKRQRA